MNIFIVRHAETELNNQGIIQGSDIDTEINKNGMLQSNKFFYKYKKYPFQKIYISTDYVYDGISGNFKETDCMKPFTKYGWSKLGGECAVQMYDNHLILRMAMNKKPFPHPKALKDMKKS